jgi:DNA-binding protein H-NS
MSEYQRLQTQIAELQKQAAAIRDLEKQTAIGSINELIQAFDLSAHDLRFASGSAWQPRAARKRAAPSAEPRRRHPTAGTTVPPLYRDEQGNTWSGRGAHPKWLREAIAGGRARESFRITV